jgi:MATE family multidrug resistance protein
MDTEIFQNWSTMIKLAMPSLVMYEADTIGFEIMTVMAGRMGTAEIGAHTLLIMLCASLYKVPLSMGVATGTEIAKCLGQGSARKAHRTATISLYLAGGIACAPFLMLTSLRQFIPRFLTNDSRIVALMHDVMPIIATFQFIDAFVGVMNSVIRGMGKQSFGAGVQLFGCYVIGLPTCALTALGLGWHLKGLWAGIALTMLVVVLLEGMYLWSVDWEKLVVDAELRNASELGE